MRFSSISRNLNIILSIIIVIYIFRIAFDKAQKDQDRGKTLRNIPKDFDRQPAPIIEKVPINQQVIPDINIPEKPEEKSCPRSIELKELEEKDLPDFPLFFVETARHSSLDARQACTIESAVRNSGRSPVILMSSQYLIPEKSNATCQLLNKFGDQVKFFKYDFSDFVKGTPLEALVVSELNRNQQIVTHESDMMRQVAIYKYGGMYLDLDFVIVKNLLALKNSVTMTNMARNYETAYNNSEYCNPQGPSERGHIQNAFVSFEKHHPLPWLIMEKLVKGYHGDQPRHMTGPLMSTGAITELYKTNNLRGYSTSNLTVLPTYSFFPSGANRAHELFNYKKDLSPKDWDNFFQCTYAVHFYSYLSKNWSIGKNPARSAYVYLAPKHCPVSFQSTEKF
ncbi:lactosylceramide 4-alpha-galactosyltransferase-like [Convolutriloba macropyga]|uniref:lactosylceramide 4-alpha-galactosyltransferase-like n=1 Tax=Convolutriloba macropyga TaxID=536237 RepID=UPI003F51AFA0